VAAACRRNLIGPAAVVGLDIDSQITSGKQRPDYLGLQCDVTSEEAIGAALESAVRNFGGKVKSGDSNVRDALPTRTDAGVLYHVTYLDKYLKDTQVNGAGSIVATMRTSMSEAITCASPSPRARAEHPGGP